MAFVPGDAKAEDDAVPSPTQTTSTDPEKKARYAESEHESHGRAESDAGTLSQQEEDVESHRRSDDDDDDNNVTGAMANPDPVFHRTQSQTPSTRSRPLTVVPASKRRGLLARFCLIPEVERPHDYSRKTKWTITFFVAVAASGGPLGSNLLYPALNDIARDLHTTETLVNLTVAFYMLAMSIFPLWWSSFSETLGRRTIYVISFALFVLFSALSAISTNIGMLIALRILGGGASASVQAVGAGTIADIWPVRERGKAMNAYYLGPVLAPFFAPIIGGALAQGFGWQSTMWFLAAFGAVNWLSLVFFLPETLAKKKPLLFGLSPPPSPATAIPASPTSRDRDGDGDGNDDNTRPVSLARMSTRQSAAVQARSCATMLRKAFIDPLHCITFLRFPPVALTVAFASVAFASLFILNISIQSTFSKAPYGFSTLIVGLLYIPSSVGYTVSSLLGGRWVDHIMAREAAKAGRYDEKGELVYLPEDRMRENAWIAASLFPLSLLWFGWCADQGVSWAAAIVPNFFFGMGTMLVFGAATTMLTEFMPEQGSSGVALNNFVRNIFSCVGVVVTEPLIGAMGVGWLCTMVSLFALVFGNGCVFLLLRYSPKWRRQLDAKKARP